MKLITLIICWSAAFATYAQVNDVNYSYVDSTQTTDKFKANVLIDKSKNQAVVTSIEYVVSGSVPFSFKYSKKSAQYICKRLGYGKVLKKAKSINKYVYLALVKRKGIQLTNVIGDRHYVDGVVCEIDAKNNVKL